MQSFHQFSRPKEGGLIRHHDLADWWAGAFDDEERDAIERICDPGGEMLLAQGRIWESSGNAITLLNGLYTDLAAADNAPLALKVVLKSYDLAQRGTDLLDLHYTCQHVIEAYECQSSDTVDPLIEASETQIRIALEVAQLLAKAGQRALPRHRGYTTLVRIHEEDGNYPEAIRLAEQAQVQGWQGEWDKILKRCRKQDTKKPRRKLFFEFRNHNQAPQEEKHDTPRNGEPQTSTYQDSPTKTTLIETNKSLDKPMDAAPGVARSSLFRHPPTVKANRQGQATQVGSPAPAKNLASLQDRIRECEVTIRTLNANLSASREELRTINSSKERLLEDQETLTSSELKATESLSSAQERISQLERALEKEATLRKNAEDDLNAHAQKLKQLEGEVSAAQELLDEASEEQYSLQTTLSEKDRRLDEQTAKLKEGRLAAERKLAENAPRIEHLEEETKHLRAELQQARQKTLQQAQLEAQNLRRILRERDRATILSPDWDYDPYSATAPDERVYVNHECQTCKQTLRIPREFVGWYGKCKFCGSDIKVSHQEK